MSPMNTSPATATIAVHRHCSCRRSPLHSASPSAPTRAASPPPFPSRPRFCRSWLAMEGLDRAASSALFARLRSLLVERRVGCSPLACRPARLLSAEEREGVLSALRIFMVISLTTRATSITAISSRGRNSASTWNPADTCHDKHLQPGRHMS